MELPTINSLKEALAYQQKIYSSLLIYKQQSELLSKLDIIINNYKDTVSCLVETSEIKQGIHI